MDTATELVDRIRVYALANISDPSLCVRSVAAAHGIWERRPHRLFRAAGISFSAWIRHKRFARIRRDLPDPAHDGRTIASVAAQWGIHDPATWGAGSGNSTGGHRASCARGGVRASAEVNSVSAEHLPVPSYSVVENTNENSAGSASRWYCGSGPGPQDWEPMPIWAWSRVTQTVPPA